ncbi:helix-turn-helix domain-containing protein [Cellvibrio sp.]
MSDDATGIGSSLNITLLPSELADTNSCCSVQDTAVRLKLIRNAIGYSQRELAKRAGVTNSSISMIEQGQVSPSIQSLSRILAAFPISLADFFSFKFSGDIHAPSAEMWDVHALNNCHQQLDVRTEYLLAGQSSVFSVPAADCCGVILYGSLQLTLLSGTQLLNQGESFYIPANQLFRLINLSGHDASLFRCSLFVHKG